MVTCVSVSQTVLFSPLRSPGVSPHSWHTETSLAPGDSAGSSRAALRSSESSAPRHLPPHLSWSCRRAPVPGDAAICSSRGQVLPQEGLRGLAAAGQQLRRGKVARTTPRGSPAPATLRSGEPGREDAEELAVPLGAAHCMWTSSFADALLRPSLTLLLLTAVVIPAAVENNAARRRNKCCHALRGVPGGRRARQAAGPELCQAAVPPWPPTGSGLASMCVRACASAQVSFLSPSLSPFILLYKT